MQTSKIDNSEIAVLLPCYNEEKTIVKVIKDFKKSLPTAKIYVFDNNSTDKSYQLSKDAGAIVYKVKAKGKGNVVRRMFRNIEADVYIMCDSDDTYPADMAPKLIQPILDRDFDIVTGDRITNDTYKKENKRALHGFGNELVKFSINTIFGSNIKDVMTGYRAFSRQFVKTVPTLSHGFETETEMTLHALDKNFDILEIPIIYRDRPADSFSKLNTFKDGFLVLMEIFFMFKDFRPLIFYTLCSVFFTIISAVIAYLPLKEFFEYSFVYRVPSLILSSVFLTLAGASFVIGLVLDTINKYHMIEYDALVKKS